MASFSFPSGKGASPALSIGSAQQWLSLPALALEHVVVPRNMEQRKDHRMEWQGFPALKSQKDTPQSCGSVCASSCVHP